ncbi:hypothetical protein Bbelb_242590 [Branchiostoma belcheri]|nr:hypothetical protein Bbelb_242590 [Branchiostoma belcheri]
MLLKTTIAGARPTPEPDRGGPGLHHRRATAQLGPKLKRRSQPAVRAFCPYVFWEATSATFSLKTWGRSGVYARESHGCARCKSVVCTLRLAVSGCVHRTLRKW